MRAPLVVSSLLFALTVSAGLVGCRGNSLDGKWNVAGAQGMPPGTLATYEFNGGNAVMAATMKDARMGEFTVKITGPYKLEGDKLTIDANDVQLDDSKILPAIKPMLAKMDLKGQMSKGLKENNSYTVKFDSSDQILLTGKQGSATLTRIK